MIGHVLPEAKGVSAAPEPNLILGAGDGYQTGNPPSGKISENRLHKEQTGGAWPGLEAEPRSYLLRTGRIWGTTPPPMSPLEPVSREVLDLHGASGMKLTETRYHPTKSGKNTERSAWEWV